LWENNSENSFEIKKNERMRLKLYFSNIKYSYFIEDFKRKKRFDQINSKSNTIPLLSQ